MKSLLCPIFLILVSMAHSAELTPAQLKSLTAFCNAAHLQIQGKPTEIRKFDSKEILVKVPLRAEGKKEIYEVFFNPQNEVIQLVPPRRYSENHPHDGEYASKAIEQKLIARVSEVSRAMSIKYYGGADITYYGNGTYEVVYSSISPKEFKKIEEKDGFPMDALFTFIFTKDFTLLGIYHGA